MAEKKSEVCGPVYPPELYLTDDTKPQNNVLSPTNSLNPNSGAQPLPKLSSEKKQYHDKAENEENVTYMGLPPPPPGFKHPYGVNGEDPDGAYFGQPPPYSHNDEPFIYKNGDDQIPIADAWQGFSDKAVRRAFVRKVYGVLLAQLVFTVGLVALFILEPHVRYFVQNHVFLYIASYIIFIIVYIVLVCCASVRRQWPTNAILLSIFTGVLGYMVAAISSFHDTYVVLMALGICASCCLGITIFSCHSKFDFTSRGGILFVFCWVLFTFGILAIFTYNQIMQTIYAVLGALLFMGFLAFDTQMLVGGKKYQLSPEEHIFAALQLYLDIVYIFLFVLTLISGAGWGGRK